MVKKTNETVIRFCRDCALSTPDMKFENLSLEGKPTLLSCPHRQWRMVITTTDVCKHYTTHAVSPETVTESSETKNTMDNWLDW